MLKATLQEKCIAHFPHLWRKEYFSYNVNVHSFFLYKNVVFPAQAEYSYFSADFRLKIFLYYS